jgi:hypothetical protein
MAIIKGCEALDAEETPLAAECCRRRREGSAYCRWQPVRKDAPNPDSSVD